MYKEFNLNYYSVSVHPDRLLITPNYERHGSSKKFLSNVNEADELLNYPKLKKVKFNTEGHLSPLSIRKLSRAIAYLTLLSSGKEKKAVINYRDINFKLIFITLTLSSPQVHSDQFIKSRLINQFIVEMKKKFKVNNYVWRMERQKNGRVHFHFIIDRFIQYQWLKDTWNRLQNKLGYIDRFSDSMQFLSFEDYFQLHVNQKKYNRNEAKKIYNNGVKNNWRHPNSTDIHSLRFVNNITSYLSAYLTKKEQNQELEGRLYGTSQNLSDIKGARDIICSDISAEINKIMLSKKFKYIKGDYFELIFIDFIDLRNLNCSLLYNLFLEYMLLHFDFHLQRSFL
jgi:hypothetical protein